MSSDEKRARYGVMLARGILTAREYAVFLCELDDKKEEE